MRVWCLTTATSVTVTANRVSFWTSIVNSRTGPPPSPTSAPWIRSIRSG
jgi:hypothetical protein